MADLSESLKEILAKFFTAKEHFEGFVHQVKRQDLESALTEVLDLYARDKNSSTLREFITVTMAGYKWRKGEKLGFNGWQTVGEAQVWADVKPNNLERSSGKRFNGAGSFNDFTPERFEAHKKQRLNVLVSCFIDGELVLFVEFPFNCPQFTARLGAVLEKRFPGGIRPSGQYLRGAGFNWNHYKDCNARLVFLNRKIIESEENIFTKGFRRWVLYLAESKAKTG